MLKGERAEILIFQKLWEVKPIYDIYRNSANVYSKWGANSVKIPVILFCKALCPHCLVAVLGQVWGMKQEKFWTFVTCLPKRGTSRPSTAMKSLEQIQCVYHVCKRFTGEKGITYGYMNLNVQCKKFGQYGTRLWLFIEGSEIPQVYNLFT